jgi:hypothetical protein
VLELQEELRQLQQQHQQALQTIHEIELASKRSIAGNLGAIVGVRTGGASYADGPGGGNVGQSGIGLATTGGKSTVSQLNAEETTRKRSSARMSVAFKKYPSFNTPESPK